jgi:uncharacterized damage-inducible protein DinB
MQPGETVMATQFASLAKSALIAELQSLRDAIHELAGPLSENQLWTKPIEPGNSFGHLLLHLTGNLNHFVGAGLGKTGYVRDREREFTDTSPPTKVQALANLDAAVDLFPRIVDQMTEGELLEVHPEARFGQVYQALVHLVAHFALHRGQMSYIVRLLRKAVPS